MSGKQLTAWERLSSSILSVEQIRGIDQTAVRDFGMHSLVLMENAALSCVHWLQSRFGAEAPPRTVILCGRGNNGGDGAAIARHLRVLGWPCIVFMLGPLEQLSSDAAANARVLEAGDRDGIQWWQEGLQPQLQQALAQADLVIDAMLGTGASGNPRAPFDNWIALANAAHAYRVAVDMPSGVDASTGVRGLPCYAADASLTFVAKKPAMVLAIAADVFGEIQVLPIGLSVAHIELILRETAG